MSMHRVKSSYWKEGILQTLEHWFKSVEEAIDFGTTVPASNVKVFDPEGMLIHTQDNTVASASSYDYNDSGYNYNDNSYT